MYTPRRGKADLRKSDENSLGLVFSIFRELRHFDIFGGRDRASPRR